LSYQGQVRVRLRESEVELELKRERGASWKGGRDSKIELIKQQFKNDTS